MKMAKIALVVILAAIIFVVGFLAYMGFFLNIKVGEKSVGPYTYVYEHHIGDYSKTSKVFNKLYKELARDGIKAFNAIGIYYDNPSVVQKNSLRSDCGVVLESKDLAKLPKLLEKYKARTFPNRVYPVVEFPLRNNLSFIVGVYKVYPLLMKYVEEKGYKMTTAVEIYDYKKKTISYVLTIEN